MPIEVRARVRAAGPSGLPTAAFPAADVCGSGLVDGVLLLLLESSGGGGLAGGAASSGDSAQGACGTIVTSWREGVGAGVEAEVFVSRARRAGEVGGRASDSPAPLAAAGALASAPAANAGGSGDSRLITPGGVSGRGGPPSAVASIAGCSPKSRKQEKSRRPSVDCSSRRPGSMRRSSLTVKRPWWLIQGTNSLAGPDNHTRGQSHIDGEGAPFELGVEDGNIVGAPGWSDAPLAEHSVAVSEKGTVIAVPPQVRDRCNFQHREDVGLIALQAGYGHVARAVDEGPRL